MNIKTGLVFFSSLLISISSVADSGYADGPSQFKGGSYDMSGVLNKVAADAPVKAKQIALEVKGGSFDMNGYLNENTKSRALTLVSNKSASNRKISVHANPNILFVPAS